MSTTQIMINGQSFDASALSMPDRKWREAFDTPVNGVVGIDAAKKNEIMRGMVNDERDKRSVIGFTFNGKEFDFDAASIRRITGAAANAHMALTRSNKQAGDLRWHGGLTDFGWLAKDNKDNKDNTVIHPRLN